MRLWKILLALLLVLTGSGPSALASIPLAPKNPCTGQFRGVVSGFRFYSPSAGRWIGRDPAGEEGGADLLAFCCNNPVTGCDPFGKMGEGMVLGEGMDAEMNSAAAGVGASAIGQAQAVADASFISQATELDEGLSFSVYQSSTGNYIGITSRFEARAAEQLLEREITIGKIPGLNNLSSADARAVEQTLIDTFKLGKNGGSLINKINSISPTSDPEFYINAIFRGLELLQQAGYTGF